MSVFVHDSSYADKGCEIGEGTKVWQYCHIMPTAKIGKNCSLGQNVFVANGVAVGDGVKIQNNVSLYEGVVLEDYVFCGPSMVFTNVKTPRSAFPRNTSEDYLKTTVGYGASIGANATVVCGITIGKWAFVGAGSVVTKDVPDYGLILGVPGILKGWVCKCGALLNIENDRGTCSDCQREYRKDGEALRFEGTESSVSMLDRT